MGRQMRMPFFVSVPWLLPALIAWGGEPAEPTQVKVAAVQMLGYDKTDLPRPGFDPSEAVVRYVEKAADDGAQLVVFPEYLLGRITVPGPQTERIARAAAAGKIYVVVGCWEVSRDGSFANTALLFDRSGKIAGKYHKVHAAVDHFEGQPPWSRPPQGKDDEWFSTNDPEWKMKRGRGLPGLRPGFRPDRHPDLLRRLVPGVGPHPLAQGGRDPGLDQRSEGDGGGLPREVGDVPGRGGDGRHEPGVRVGDDHRPVARPDPRRLHGTEGGLHHRHDRPGDRFGRPGRTAGTSGRGGRMSTGRS